MKVIETGLPTNTASGNQQCSHCLTIVEVGENEWLNGRSGQSFVCPVCDHISPPKNPGPSLQDVLDTIDVLISAMAKHDPIAFASEIEVGEGILQAFPGTPQK